jgi:hypothetical protein
MLISTNLNAERYVKKCDSRIGKNLSNIVFNFDKEYIISTTNKVDYKKKTTDKSIEQEKLRIWFKIKDEKYRTCGGYLEKQVYNGKKYWTLNNTFYCKLSSNKKFSGENYFIHDGAKNIEISESNMLLLNALTPISSVSFKKLAKKGKMDINCLRDAQKADKLLYEDSLESIPYLKEIIDKQNSDILELKSKNYTLINKIELVSKIGSNNLPLYSSYVTYDYYEPEYPREFIELKNESEKYINFYLYDEKKNRYIKFYDYTNSKNKSNLKWNQIEVKTRAI